MADSCKSRQNSPIIKPTCNHKNRVRMSLPELPIEIIVYILKLRSQLSWQTLLCSARRFHGNRFPPKEHRVELRRVLEELLECTESVRKSLDEQFSTNPDPLALMNLKMLQKHVPNWSTKKWMIASSKFSCFRPCDRTVVRVIIWGIEEIVL